MSKQDLFDYVMNTPHNTNPTILKQMIDENSGSGGQADWNALEGESGHVLNRTHYAFKPFEDMVFDPNNIDGVDIIDATAVGSGVFYKISDYIMTEEDFANSSAILIEDTLEMECSLVAYDYNDPTQLLIYTMSTDWGGQVIDVGGVAVATKAGNWNGLNIPSTGTYVAFAHNVCYTVIRANETVKQLDEKYLPEHLQFGTESTPGLKITEADIANATEKVDYDDVDGIIWVKVSDVIYTEADFDGLKIVYSFEDGEVLVDEHPNIMSDLVPNLKVITLSGGHGVAFVLTEPFALAESMEMLSPGLWFFCYTSGYKTISFEVPGKTTITPLDEKYLPETVATKEYVEQVILGGAW